MLLLTWIFFVVQLFRSSLLVYQLVTSSKKFFKFYCTDTTCNNMLTVFYIYTRNMEFKVAGKHLCIYLCNNHFWLYYGITDVPQPCRCASKDVLCLSSRALDANNLKAQAHTIYKHPAGSTRATKSTPSK